SPRRSARACCSRTCSTTRWRRSPSSSARRSAASRLGSTPAETSWPPSPPLQPPPPAVNADMSRWLHLYAERFNRRDWDGVRELTAADARLQVADRFAGRLSDSSYFDRYESWTFDWRLAVGEVDGDDVVI